MSLCRGVGLAMVDLREREREERWEKIFFIRSVGWLDAVGWIPGITLPRLIEVS